MHFGQTAKTAVSNFTAWQTVLEQGMVLPLQSDQQLGPMQPWLESWLEMIIIPLVSDFLLEAPTASRLMRGGEGAPFQTAPIGRS